MLQASALDNGPWVAVILPIATSAASTSIAVAAGWVAFLVHRWAGDQKNATERAWIDSEIDVIKSKAQTWAGQMIAASATNLAGEEITCVDPRVEAAAESILKDIPIALHALGWDADRIAKLVAGEIGRLQPPPPAPLAPASAK